MVDDLWICVEEFCLKFVGECDVVGGFEVVYVEEVVLCSLSVEE